MTIHASERVIQRYNLKTPDKLSPANVPLGKEIFARDAGNALHQWSMDLFRYDGTDCVAIINCATNLTLFLHNAQSQQMDQLGNILARFLLDIYTGDAKMHACLRRFFQDEKYLVFSRLKNRSMTAALSRMIVDYSHRGQRFRDYTDFRNVLHICQYNYDANFNYSLTRLQDGVEVSYTPGLYFKQIIMERYGNENPSAED